MQYYIYIFFFSLSLSPSLSLSLSLSVSLSLSKTMETHSINVYTLVLQEPLRFCSSPSTPQNHPSKVELEQGYAYRNETVYSMIFHLIAPKARLITSFCQVFSTKIVISKKMPKFRVSRMCFHRWCFFCIIFRFPTFGICLGSIDPPSGKYHHSYGMLWNAMEIHHYSGHGCFSSN